MTALFDPTCFRDYARRMSGRPFVDPACASQSPSPDSYTRTSSVNRKEGTWGRPSSMGHPSVAGVQGALGRQRSKRVAFRDLTNSARDQPEAAKATKDPPDTATTTRAGLGHEPADVPRRPDRKRPATARAASRRACLDEKTGATTVRNDGAAGAAPQGGRVVKLGGTAARNGGSLQGPRGASEVAERAGRTRRDAAPTRMPSPTRSEGSVVRFSCPKCSHEHVWTGAKRTVLVNNQRRMRCENFGSCGTTLTVPPSVSAPHLAWTRPASRSRPAAPAAAQPKHARPQPRIAEGVMAGARQSGLEAKGHGLELRADRARLLAEREALQSKLEAEVDKLWHILQWPR